MQRLNDTEFFQLGADELPEAGLDSRQNQAVSLEGLKVGGVAGRQFCPAADGQTSPLRPNGYKDNSL